MGAPQKTSLLWRIINGVRSYTQNDCAERARLGRAAAGSATPKLCRGGLAGRLKVSNPSSHHIIMTMLSKRDIVPYASASTLVTTLD